MKRHLKAGIVIQARMRSLRLPGKTLLPLAGRPALQRLVERLQSVPGMIVVATSGLSDDDPVAELCAKQKYALVRGDEENVLERYVLAAREFDLDPVIRVTGDSPLIDPSVVRAMLDSFGSLDVDYYSNLRPRTLPRGFGCEIFRRTLLEAAYSDRRPEDVGEYVVIPYLERHIQTVRMGNYRIDGDYSALRLTLDEPADYEVIRRVYDALYPGNPVFSYRDVIDFLGQHPEIRALNAHVASRNA